MMLSWVLFSKILPSPYCMFVISICYVFHGQIAVEFFLVWQWCFIESLPTIDLCTCINTFLQHQATSCLYHIICRYIGISWLSPQILFYDLSCSLHTWMLVFCLWQSHIEDQTCNLCIYLSGVRQQDQQPGLILS